MYTMLSIDPSEIMAYDSSPPQYFLYHWCNLLLRPPRLFAFIELAIDSITKFQPKKDKFAEHFQDLVRCYAPRIGQS
jgi:hypothetical protein